MSIKADSSSLISAGIRKLPASSQINREMDVTWLTLAILLRWDYSRSGLDTRFLLPCRVSEVPANRFQERQGSIPFLYDIVSQGVDFLWNKG